MIWARQIRGYVLLIRLGDISSRQSGADADGGQIGVVRSATGNGRGAPGTIVSVNVIRIRVGAGEIADLARQSECGIEVHGVVGSGDNVLQDLPGTIRI